MTYRLSFGSAFSLSTAPIPRVVACGRGEYAKHHGINRCEHPAGKIVGWCRSAPRRRQVERDDPNLLEVDQISQPVPVRRGKAVAASGVLQFSER